MQVYVVSECLRSMTSERLNGVADETTSLLHFGYFGPGRRLPTIGGGLASWVSP